MATLGRHVNGATMLHDGLQPRRQESAACGERRHGPRVPYPAELVLAWHCEMPTMSRYTVIDVGDGGFRIRSAAPLTRGMTGTAVTLLPEGHEIGAAVMVIWCNEASNGDGYEVGLRRF